ALLFCPDEKTARTVTQVLGDLDFNVTPCTEPFAAVKKFMSERFDAVVVDCDNEQNATLLFKSARSAPNNQGALAVAVVEGQAGVAKAFRIGANLVLTKPINVEQAKGTLRVARGLLRKNEGTKPANAGAAGSAAPMPSAPKPVPAKPAPQASVPNAAEIRTPGPTAPISAPVIPIQPPAAQAQPGLMESVRVETRKPITEPAVAGKATPDAAEIVSAQPLPAHSASVGPLGAAPKISSAPTVHAETKLSSGYAASAPAPARESTPSAPAEAAKAVDSLDHGIRADSKDHVPSSDKTSAPLPTLTFGGTVGAAHKPASSGSKTALIAVACVIVIAAGGYAAWTKWKPSFSPANTSAKIGVQPTMAPSPAPTVRDAENTSSVSVQTTVSPKAETQTLQSETNVTQKPAKAAKAEMHPAEPHPAETHPAKTDAASEARNQDADVVAENTAPAPAAQPILIKNGKEIAAAKPTETADAPALSMNAIAPASEALPNLGPAAAATPVLQRLVVSQGVSRGLLVKEVPPVYPRTAVEMRIEGAVQLQATVAKTGSISEIKVLSGDKELARAAVDAVKQWKYKPYLLNGEPVDIQTQITVKFKLPE
ncbi:MAG: TonB family protein, partial [Candidatus Sulfotelmatobacter sp.]